MSFIYPLFLVAGLALAIPVLIHLFNLRRYKTVYFPHTRFLKSIQLRSQKSSQVRYKWLLAARLLFLLMLILAFAQPFFNSTDTKDAGNRLQAIYIDNSGSMSLKKGVQRLVDVAKDAARKQVKNAAPGAKFVLLTNDKPVSYRPMPADKTLIELGAIDISAKHKNTKQVLSVLESISQSESAQGTDLYYYSDFQQSVVAEPPQPSEGLTVYAIPLSGDKVSNVYVDTAYLLNPVLQIGETNELVVHTKLFGEQPEQPPVLNLVVNGQIKSAATLNFGEGKEIKDTLTFRVNDAAWQKIALSVDDANVRFDDTFRVTARSAPNLSVLCLNEGSSSAYIQAAFRSYDGVRLTNANMTNAPEDWSTYSLVLLNGCTNISASLGKRLSAAQLAGQSVCILPARTANTAMLNEGLKQTAEINVVGIDTATEVATSLQQGNDLVKNMFDVVPENVQLPVANWHYILQSGITANRQSVLSFRNCDPLFAQFSPNAGKLYILTTGIDPQSGSFASSYFFAPFLYQMAIQANGGNVYALTLGSRQPAYLPLNNANERNMVHLYHNGMDAIPTQRSQGAGLNVFIDDVVEQSGFYPLTSSGNDTTIIAMNGNRAESALEITEVAGLGKLWQGIDVQVINADSIGTTGGYNRWGSFPLWKVCVILALIMLAVETWVLAGGLRKPTAATE